MENSIKSISGNEIEINSLIKNILTAKEVAYKKQPKQDLTFPYIELYGGSKEKISPKHVKLAPMEGNLGEILNRVRCRMKERENNYNYIKSLKFLNQNDSAEKMIKKLSNIDVEKLIIEKSRKNKKKKTLNISPTSSKISTENTFDGALNRLNKVVITDIVGIKKSKPQPKKIINLNSTPSPPSNKQIRYFFSPNNRKSSYIAQNIMNTDFDNGSKRLFKKRLSSFSPKRNSKASIDRISEDSYNGLRKVDLSELVVEGQLKPPVAKKKTCVILQILGNL